MPRLSRITVPGLPLHVTRLALSLTGNGPALVAASSAAELYDCAIRRAWSKVARVAPWTAPLG